MHIAMYFERYGINSKTACLLFRFEMDRNTIFVLYLYSKYMHISCTY